MTFYTPDVLRRKNTKDIIMFKLVKWLCNYLKKCRSSHQRSSVKKLCFKNFAIFTGKHLCWSFFLIQNIAKFFRAPILKNTCKWQLLKMFAKPVAPVKLKY